MDLMQAKAEPINKTDGASVKTYLRQGKTHQTCRGVRGEKRSKTQQYEQRSEKKVGKEVLHDARISIYIGDYLTDHAGAVGYFVKELQPMDYPRQRSVRRKEWQRYFFMY